MGQLVADDVQRHERLAVRRLGTFVAAEGVDAPALGTERGRRGEGVVTVERVDDADDAAPAAVDALPAVLTGEVVVGPTHVDVAVDHRRARPVVVRVGRDVLRCPAPHVPRSGRRQSVEACLVEADVEGDDLAGAELVVCLEPAAVEDRAHLLAVAEDPHPGSDGRLRAERVDRVHQPAVGGAREVVAAVVERRAVGEDVRAGREGEHHQLRLLPVPQAGAGLLLEEDARLGGGDRRHRAESQILMERAERRHRRTPIELPCHPRPEHGHAADELRRVLVRAAGQRRVVGAGRDGQLAGAQHSVDARVPGLDLGGRRPGPHCHRYHGRRRPRRHLCGGRCARRKGRNRHQADAGRLSESSRHLCSLLPPLVLRLQNLRRRPPPTCSPPAGTPTVPPPADARSTVARA